MVDKVALGASMRANLLSLQKTNSLLDTSQLRLSTGRKVNSALDDPRSFFTAQGLTNRAGDLSRLLDGMGQSIQTVIAIGKVAEQAALQRFNIAVGVIAIDIPPRVNLLMGQAIILVVGSRQA